MSQRRTPGPRPASRRQMEAASDVLEWLASGNQDPAMKADISAVQHLLWSLIEVTP